jgi:hypothetical protein
MTPVVGALPQVTILGIDDRSNSLDIGLETMAAESTVYVQLLNLGIPLDAVNITQVARAHFTQNLWGRERPLVGGLKAEGFFGAPNNICTLGFNAQLVLEKGKAAVDGFVTCSHCQFAPGVDDDGTNWYQPVRDPVVPDENLVGPKKRDPCYRSDPGNTCGLERMCPVGKTCRRSDSAFVMRDAAKVPGALGSIARPEPGAPPPFVYGKNTFKIVGEVNPMCCVSVEKIGQTTGRTIGEVKLTGQYVPVERDRAILDATLVNMIVQKGDSGAPVITLVDTKCAANPCTANLAGIVFAVDGPIAYFSPVADIRLATELGNTLVTH